MIVKNEVHTISKCLASVKDWIDYWVIVDTGSTDGTQDLIKSLMGPWGIPGELHEMPWIDFSTNRNQSLDLARPHGDYILVMDADDWLEVESPTWLDQIHADVYSIEIVCLGEKYYRPQLFTSDLEFRYKGVIHEFLEGPVFEGTKMYREGVIRGSRIIASTSAPAGDPKYLLDAQIIERELSRGVPDLGLQNRYLFYLAQSLRDGGDLEGAVRKFSQRAASGGWEEEVYVSLWQQAKLYQKLGRDESLVIDSYLKAWEYRRSRVEALFELVRYLTSLGRDYLAWILIREGFKTPPTKDTLYVDEEILNWRLLNQYAINAARAGHLAEALGATESIIASDFWSTIPEEEQKKIYANIESYEMQLIGDFY
jgi:glycosyltransferase involved in cell wall biosynthesis